MHTKGPWEISKHASTMIQDSAGRTICSTGSYSNNNLPDGGQNENKANAAFIVKACNMHEELLEALKRILSLAERNGDEDISDIKWAAKNAIAKAEAAND